MTRLFLLTTLTLLSLTGFAQFSINGTVKDSSGKALQYATVELFRKTVSDQPVRSVFTDDKGAFAINKVDTGSYRVIISFTGFAQQEKEIVLNQNLVLEETVLQRSNGALQGVVVTARKPLIEQTDDKIIFNVENDPATKTENAIDILRKTPFVSVDGDNNVLVNGQSNFKVLLNGRETAMFAQNVKEALKGFPGAIITKIEVITSPSAKYDAEGVGGIINIITKKKVVGYNGSVNTWTNSIGWYNINTNFSAKFGKVGMTMYYGAGGGINVPGKTRVETIPLVPSEYTNRLLTGRRQFNNFWNFGNAEVNWELDTLNTVSFYGNVSGGKNTNRVIQDITTSYTSGGDSVSHFDLTSRNVWPSYNVGSDFIRKFASNKEREFSLRLNAELGIGNTFLNSFMDNETRPDMYVINNSEADNRQYTVQADYIHPLKNSWKIEGGLKTILRKAQSDFEGLVGTTKNDVKPNSANTDQFEYHQNVYSAYGSLGFKRGKTTFRLGGRVEATTVDGNFRSSHRTVDQNYLNFLPNIQASTKFSNSFTLVVTYSDRIQRPFIQNLNPFVNNNDPKNIYFGNPDLEPQVIHSLAIQTRVSKGATFAGLTFTGTYSDNMIVQYASFDPATGVTSNTSGNVGREYGLNVNGNANVRLSTAWNMSLNGFVRYSHIENKIITGRVNKGVGGNANLNTTYTFSKRFNASGYAGFYQNPISLQTKYPLNLWYGLNFGYKMFNEKLTISGGIANFFEKERAFTLVTEDPAFIYRSTSIMPFRGLSLSINWSFGKLTENVSKKKGVNNDDVLQSSSN